MTRFLALLLTACSLETHAPSILDPLCTRVEIATYTAGPDECLLLADKNGLTLFRRADSDSCGGPPCLVLQPGETAYALAKIKPGPEPAWREHHDAGCVEQLRCP